jgi:ribosomal protein S18 acetylase RimI-like enzyme
MRQVSVRLGIGKREDAAVIADMSGRFIEQGLPRSWSESRVLNCMRNREAVTLVGRDRRLLVGFAIMEFLDEHAHLSLLAVVPGRRRTGVGRSLLEWLEATARTAGIFKIMLELRETNLAARCFYERLGYVVVGRRLGYYAGKEHALCMARDLRASRTHVA